MDPQKPHKGSAGRRGTHLYPKHWSNKADAGSSRSAAYWILSASVTKQVTSRLSERFYLKNKEGGLAADINLCPQHAHLQMVKISVLFRNVLIVGTVL